MPKRKKSKYRHTVINKKKYYFYKVIWKDILGDSGHADSSEFDKMEPAMMVSQAYLYSKDKKNLKLFASYDSNDEVFSDRNVIPMGCVVKLEKVQN